MESKEKRTVPIELRIKVELRPHHCYFLKDSLNHFNRSRVKLSPLIHVCHRRVHFQRVFVVRCHSPNSSSRFPTAPTAILPAAIAAALQAALAAQAFPPSTMSPPTFMTPSAILPPMFLMLSQSPRVSSSENNDFI